jgi:hypothetical protein
LTKKMMGFATLTLAFVASLEYHTLLTVYKLLVAGAVINNKSEIRHQLHPI